MHSFIITRFFFYHLLQKTFCLVFGMSVNLLGRLCGFYVCGDLGMQARSSADMARALA